MTRVAFWRCALDTYTVESAEPKAAGNPVEATSPDGLSAVFKDGPNLGLRVDGKERPLTTDGDSDHEYGVSPD